MKKSLLFFFCLLLPALFFSQDENLRYYDYIYLDNIRSVKFNVAGLLLSSPIIKLRSGTPLELSFDDMDGDYKEYVYSVVHCDANWQPSNLIESEFLEGFSENRIENYEYSFKTKSIYTHYRLLAPNRDMRLTKSGNYLLKVYEDEDEKRLAITRRFMLVEDAVRIHPEVVKPAMVSKSDTHQEIDFSITHEGFEIRNPRQELFATILQNGRWDNAITGVPPLFTRQEEQLFDYQNRIVFPAGKEFRYLDLRSLENGSENIESVQYENGEYNVTLFRDEKRGNGVYLEYEDINGDFVIETFDDQDHDLESSYANVLFKLYSPTEMYDYDLYIFGRVTDWQLKPEFKMTYNPAISCYVARAPLKQGYYNYYYAAFPKKGSEPSFEETEGNWHETNNLYTILIYYRPFGGRYDQIIGSFSFSSRL